MSLLGRGSYNFVYRLQFEDGSDVAASISKDDEKDFNPSAKLSEISTMRYVWESQELYPQIPVPKIHVWDLSFNNPIGAPYVLMEVSRGVSLSLRADDGLKGLNSMTFADQLIDCPGFGPGPSGPGSGPDRNNRSECPGQ